MTLNRRFFLLYTALLAGFAAAASPPRAHAAETGELYQPPALGERSLGRDDAPVTIIEYSSATCIHCATFHHDILPMLKAEYIETGKVRFVFREFPFDDLALAAFMLARCAPADRYFPIIDLLFQRQKNWAVPKGARAELFRIAQLSGFTTRTFDACLKNREVAEGILDIREIGEKFGVSATPTLFINGEMLRGNPGVDELRKLIDKALEQ